MTTWAPDVLGDGYQQLTIPLGTDPDGEGEVKATLIRYQPPQETKKTGRAVLYVNGFTDYFFQKHLAEHFAEQGYAFFALDLRKCGRSLEPGQTPHFVSDLSLYDAELDEALRQGGRVLDVGCGPGLMLLQLAAAYPKATFVGLDVVEVGGLETARRLSRARGFDERIHVERVSADQMTYVEAFDGVLITRVFHEIPLDSREGLFRACYRALKRPGVLLNLDFAYPDTLAEFREPLFWSGVDNQYREMSWGTVHPTWQEQHQMLTEAGFAPIERHFVRHIPQGPHYLAIAHKR